MGIPLVDLKAQYREIADEVMEATRAVHESSAFILGPDVTAFEHEFAAFCDTRFTVGTGSGTDALHLAVRALDIGPGDEVITVANTFIATLIGINLAGARPVLVDCDEKTALIDADQVAAAITPRTKAIIPVHLFGRCVDMRPLEQLAEEHGLKLIEDAAQAHGADHLGRRAGSVGSIGCFSFYPGKNLGAYGDGGACTTDSEELHHRLRMLRNWGSSVKYHHEEFGMNSRLDTVQAAVLRCKLRRLNDWNARRLNRAERYNALLADVDGVQCPELSADGRHVFHLYVIRVANRDDVLASLHAAEIGAGIHYPIPCHLTAAGRSLGHGEGDFPVSERLAGCMISLPLFPELTDAQQDTVVDVLRDAVNG
jgi:dTDP-4-amino-4,6-dideoxygalactose transaminase